MRAYADTNFYPRLYLRLPDSEEALHWMEKARRPASQPLPITWLHRLEIVNALQLHVFTSRQPGQVRITPEQAAAAQATFQGDLAQSHFLRRAHVELSELEAQFEELALRHTAKHGFRTYDLIHVASALILKCDAFWSFDPKASKLASLEGLRLR
jgi:predicted nucleic acid-binding protein